MAEFKLYCFPQSGNAYKAGLCLNLVGADWEPIAVDYFGGETRTKEMAGDHAPVATDLCQACGPSRGDRVFLGQEPTLHSLSSRRTLRTARSSSASGRPSPTSRSWATSISPRITGLNERCSADQRTGLNEGAGLDQSARRDEGGGLDQRGPAPRRAANKWRILAKA